MSTTFQHSPNGTSPTKAKNIQIRRVQLTDPTQMPSDLSSTPGGTLFSTTPGGTRIVYDRAFLLECRNSPLAKSPPVGLPPIPGVTCVAVSPNLPKNGVTGVGIHQHHHTAHGAHLPPQVHHAAPTAPVQKSSVSVDEPQSQFEMDM
jgi:hypothetical protein